MKYDKVSKSRMHGWRATYAAYIFALADDSLSLSFAIVHADSCDDKPE